MSNFKETIVISLGGSMIVPDGVDGAFLKKFKELIEKHLNEGKQFFIITGGGMTARSYIKALQEVRGTVESDDLDWMGIYATHINAQLVRLALSDLGSIGTLADPSVASTNTEPIVVTGGWKPGWSSDYPAVLIAGNGGSGKVINLSNISHVYSEDPRKNPDAERFDAMSWDQYISIIPEKWEPGLSSPFDPIASRKAQELGVEAAIMNGSDLDNLDKYLSGENFEGTVIGKNKE